MLGIFGQPLFTDVILPFVLVFVVLFAVLQKTQVLGKDKSQIDAMVSFIAAILFIAFPGASAVVNKMIGVTGIIIVILLVFMIMFGFVGGQTKEGLNQGLKITFGIAIAVALVITLLWSTGTLHVLTGNESWMKQLQNTIVLLAFIGGAFAIVLTSSAAKKEK